MREGRSAWECQIKNTSFAAIEIFSKIFEFPVRIGPPDALNIIGDFSELWIEMKAA